MQEIELVLGKKAESDTFSPRTSIDISPPLATDTPQPQNTSPPGKPQAKQVTVRFSDEIETSDKPGHRTARPKRPEEGPSVVDQVWGELFDGKGEPTTRLEEVFRGLANYIV